MRANDQIERRARSARSAISSARTSLGVRCPCTWTLHCDFRFGEAKLLIERGNTRWDRAQNPSDSPVIAHGRFDQGAAYAFSPMLLGHDEHRNVTVCYTVAKGAQEAAHFATLNGHKRQL